MEQVTLPAGTIVKVNGMPFRLPQDTVVEGRGANLGVASPTILPASTAEK